MNLPADEQHNWLASSLPDIAAVQAQLRVESQPNLCKSSQQNSPLQRYPLTRGIFAVPILHDASPDTPNSSEGITIDFSNGGITFEVGLATPPRTPKWLLGVEKNDGEYGFMTVISRHVHPAEMGLRISATVAPPSRDPLSAESLKPFLDWQSHKFRTKLEPAVLEQWLALGVLQARLLDRVLVCPNCFSLPTFRNGCRACGSIEVTSQRLIHHFACAHVGHVTSFEYDAELVCPKCRVRKLVVGADFEYLDGPFQCQDCQWSDTELATIARCAACGSEFASDEAAEREVIGYHVDRMEPLDFVATN